MKSTPAHTPLTLEVLEQRIAPATFIVTNASDSGTGSLRDAVTLANNSAGDDTIVFDSALTTNNSKITLTSGEIAVTGPLAIKGPGGSGLTISGNSMSRIFNVTDGDNAVDSHFRVSGVTLTQGNTGGSGGAITSTESVTIENSFISGNTASGPGGAINLYNAGAGPKLTIKGSSFVGNSGSYGGAINFGTDSGSVLISKSTFSKNTGTSGAGVAFLSIGAAGTSSSAITIDSSVFTNNGASTFDGGALVLENAAASGAGKILIKKSQFNGNFAASSGGGISINEGTATIDGSLISGNVADAGGGIELQGGTILLKNTKVLSNAATSGVGGGIQIGSATSVVLDKAFVSGNTSTTGGGGIATESVSLTIKGSTISGNSTAGDGGGIFGTGGSKTLTITGSKITDNRDGLGMGDTGGGIHFVGASTLKLDKVTISGNMAYNGGGLYLGTSSSLNATKSTFDSNRSMSLDFGAPGGGAIYSTGSTAVSLIGNTFRDNTAWGDGGAATFLNVGSDVSLTSNKFFNNSAGDSGGAVFLGATSGSASVTKNTFTNNSGNNSGGAVFIDGTGVKVFNGNQIRTNNAIYGGGIAVASGAAGITLQGDVISNNVATISGGGVRELGTTFTNNATISGNSAPTFPNVATV